MKAFPVTLRACCMTFQATDSLMAIVVMPVANRTYCLLQSPEDRRSALVHVTVFLI